ncbi:hypothetical protein JTE90_026980 [Oedothorax gibbosus]|uniref:Uncharacterized protein n=1 Tax=Oedothorax gibbosus TaxID=931172 RepID=A0AAV6U174_9ARAC|nr:hypothetical protein JTE90_026980 [Oedothorax gibbosus]
MINLGKEKVQSISCIEQVPDENGQSWNEKEPMIESTPSIEQDPDEVFVNTLYETQGPGCEGCGVCGPALTTQKSRVLISPAKSKSLYLVLPFSSQMKMCSTFRSDVTRSRDRDGTI